MQAGIIQESKNGKQSAPSPVQSGPAQALSVNSGTEGTNPLLRCLSIVFSGSLPNEDPDMEPQRSGEESLRQSCPRVINGTQYKHHTTYIKDAPQGLGDRVPGR